MKKIIYIPLDERPCNYEFPKLIGDITKEYKVITPPIDIMGDKKKSGDIECLWSWLEKESEDADGAILSLDTLIYGGILPSRLHYMTLDKCLQNLKRLEKLKAKKDFKIYAFNLIMRCPRYSSADEEPDYYEDWGKEIFRYGYINHKKDLGIAKDNEVEELETITNILPEEFLRDYTNRRAVNREVNIEALSLVEKEIIDFMIIPQDDSAPYGFTAIDQQYVRQKLIEKDLELKVYMYPGADEVGCTLLGRMINSFENKKPLVYVKYSSTEGPTVIPLYEDRILNESIKYHILAQGALITTSIDEADLVLLVNSPVENMTEASTQGENSVDLAVKRNLVELVELSDYLINTRNKAVVIGDVAFANGGEINLIKLLKQRNLLYKLAGYAGWNTSSNSIGTCIAQAMIFNIYGNNDKHKDFLALRYVEDVGYCAKVRAEVCNNVATKMGFDWFKIDGKKGTIVNTIKLSLEEFIETNLINDNYTIKILDIYSPWNRMFETGLKVHVEKLEN